MLTFTIIQSDLFWEDKEANKAMFQHKIETLTQTTDIVILPEMFTTGFSMKPTLLAETMDGETVEWMRGMAIDNKIILCGSIIIEENKQYFNRFIWMLPNGQFHYYDKRHLFGFAGEDQHYTAGNRKIMEQVNGLKILPLICYDLRFPVWSRQNEEHYDILIYVANWPERRSNAWKTLLVARAIENQCYVIGVNRVGDDGNGIYHSGNSMVVDPLGEIQYHIADEEAAYTFTINKNDIVEKREKLPFLKDADHFSIML
jgi:omega-amidase